jgi:hypothetical protein
MSCSPRRSGSRAAKAHEELSIGHGKKKNPGDRPGLQWTLRASFFSSCCCHLVVVVDWSIGLLGWFTESRLPVMAITRRGAERRLRVMECGLGSKVAAS